MTTLIIPKDKPTALPEGEEFLPEGSLFGKLKSLEENAEKRSLLDQAQRTLVFYPQEVLALQTELRKHPQLLESLGHHGDDFIAMLSDLAARFHILLDGQYTEEDVLKLCDILNEKLRSSTAIIAVGACDV